MRRAAFVLLAAWFATTPALADPAPLQADAEVVRELAQVQKDLAALRGAVEAGRGPGAHRDLSSRVRRIEARVDALLERLRAEGPADTPLPMADEPFGAFREQLHGAAFSEDRLNLLRTAAADNFFTAAQAKAVLESFSFSAEQLQAAKVLAPRLTDPENGFQLYDVFRFEADRAALRDILGAARRPAPGR
jgi:hypothetical protein